MRTIVTAGHTRDHLDEALAAFKRALGGRALRYPLRWLDARQGPPPVKLLAALQADTAETLESLRDLARGIYPPLLADRGLAEALGGAGRSLVVARYDLGALVAEEIALLRRVATLYS